MTDAEKLQVQKMIQEAFRVNYQKKIGDTPTDALQLVNRRFVTNNGLISQRPKNPVKGQMFFASVATTFPTWWNGSNWVNATGSVVAGPL